MKAKGYKRFGAFLIDLMVIGLFLTMIYYFVPENKQVIKIQHDVALINEQVINNEIGKKEYFMKFSESIYELDKVNVNSIAFNILILITYFILVPIITKGKTMGLYILGLKIDGKLSIKTLFLRNLIASGLLYLLISFGLVYFVKDSTYFIAISILAFIQLLLVITSGFMIIYRRDLRGLQDIISNTNVVIIKEVKI